jgi:hypothetical protein
MIGIRSYKRGFWQNEAKFTNVFKERRSPLVGRLHAERPPIGRRTRARDEEAADGADCADEAERGRGFERLHCRNRWALCRASNLPGVLRHLPRAQLVVLHAQVDGPWQSARVSMSINRLQRPRLVVVGYGMAGNANGRGACCAGSRPVRHYRDRWRAAPEPQPHTVETIAAGPSQRLFSIDCGSSPGNDERRNAIQIERPMV